MTKLFYPAIFHYAEEGGFWISFPDIPECLTEGDNMAEAYRMAVEALNLAISDRLQNNELLPVPSSPDHISVSDGIIVIVSYDIGVYNKKFKAKAVKKTLTIPEWLNDEAIEHNINFSQVLQDALKQQLAAVHK